MLYGTHILILHYVILLYASYTHIYLYITHTLLYSYTTLHPIQVIYHLKRDQVSDAFDLIRDLEPSTPQEYILKGVAYATIGQTSNNREYIKIAQQCFQLVGTSAHECDTIPGMYYILYIVLLLYYTVSIVSYTVYVYFSIYSNTTYTLLY